MSLQLLKENILREKSLINDLIGLISKYNSSDQSDKKIIQTSINALISQIELLNSAVPNLLNNVGFYKNLNEEKKINDHNLISVSTKNGKQVSINKKSETKFVDSMLKSSPKENSPSINGSYVRASGVLFKNLSDSLIKKGYFASLKEDLRKTSSPMVVNGYVSIIFFTTFLSFFVGLLFGLMSFFILKNYYFLLIIPLFPILTFFIIYSSPSGTRKNLEKNINHELPFLTIYMSAIATSGIEPSKIFSVLITSQDYPYSQREIKKLVNYINFYGYDLVSALKNISKSCPSERLGQLFDGLATTITSGGELTEFLNKHAETLLFDYRLEREKYTHLAETFMNIYISMAVAAPMIMMMLFILLSLTGFGGGTFTPSSISLLTILVISMMNIFFIVFLNAKQPKF